MRFPPIRRLVGLALSGPDTSGYPRSYWVLFWGMLVNSSGTSLIWPFLAIYIKQRLDVPLTTITLVTAVDAASRLLITPVAGSVMDRIGRKSGLIFSLLLGAATMIGMSAANTLGLWMVLAAGLGASNSMFRVGVNAMTADLVEPERRIDAYALMRTSNNLGVAIGPVAGGFIAVVSFSLAFYFASIAHLVTTMLVIFLISETMPSEQSAREQRSSSFGQVLRDRPFMVLVSLLTLAFMPGPIVFVLLPVYLKGSFGIPESQYGFLMTSNALIVVTLQYAITRLSRRYRPLLVLAVGALFYAVGAGSMAWGSMFLAFWFSMVVLTVGEMLLAPTSTALTANLALPDMRARYMGVLALTWGVAGGIGPFLGGILNDNVGPFAIWYGALALGSLGALGLLVLELSPRQRDAWATSELVASGQRIVPSTD